MLYSDFLTGNGMFQLKHIIIIVICIALIVAGSILATKHLKIDTVHKILLGVGIVSETLKIFSYILANEGSLGGYLPKTDLPFHLCSIQLIFIILLNFSKNEKLKHLLHSFMLPTCLIGGIAAILIATSSSLNMPVVTVQYFLYHSAITAFAIYLLASKEVTFDVKDLRNCIVMLFCIFLAAIYINSVLYYKEFDAAKYAQMLETNPDALEADAYVFKSINFMYVVNPPQSGLPFLAKYPIKINGEMTDGWLVYIIHYAFLAIVAITLCYIKPIINWFKDKKAQKAA